jgi:molybdenum cofactor cytidylyltransferase
LSQRHDRTPEKCPVTRDAPGCKQAEKRFGDQADGSAMGPEIEGVILAAGLSKRMGVPKLALEIGGMTVLSRVVTEALASALSRIVVVVARAGEADPYGPNREMASSRLQEVINPFPERGMSSSLRAGLSAVKKDAAAAMVLLGDQPWITAAVINRLIEAFCNNPDSITAPAIRGKRSTPVIFPASLFPDLREETGDVGGRNVVNRHPEKIVLIEMGSDYDDRDMDTPADFNAMTRHGRVTGREE